jgi:hypothetical protein
MSIACQYDQLKYPFFLGDLTHQISVEAKLRLPENLPKISRIIGGDFQTGPTAFTVSDNFIVVSGKVYPHFLFVAELPEEREKKYHNDDQDTENYEEVRQEVDLPQEYGVSWYGESGVSYEERIEVPGIRPQMLVRADVIILRGVFEKESSDLVVFRGSLQVAVQAVDHQTAAIISDISALTSDTISLVKDQIVVEELLAPKKVTIPIHSNLMLPNLKPGVARVLKASAVASGISQEMARGRLLIRGSLNVSLVYVGCDDEGNPTEIFAHDWNQDAGSAIPFETYLDLNDGDGEILVLPRVTARDILIEPRIPHELQCLMDLDFELGLSRIYQKELVVDAIPGEGELMDRQKYLLNVEEYGGEASGEISLEQQVELPNNIVSMERILACYGTPRDVMVESSEGKVLIEGGLDLGVMYIAEGDGERKLHIANWNKTEENGLLLAGIIEFTGLQPGTLLRTQVMAESLKAEMIDDRKFKLSGIVKVRVVARTPRAIFVMKDCAMVVPVESSTRPSMLFYVVQKEDTLWKIARHYQTTVETLIKANSIANPDNIELGQKLLIPKKIVNM